ncbi:aspartate/glutamate racemase family protein [Arthrobacter sp. 2RAF6]|uniref:aspartate/glutamate racemase family protein n=1 Tax=Arthrobacter sp. 2RAF6 TaxID=3233002 RepID=UPI003F8E1FB0
MKVIGLLGGMSWESSAEYYRLANEMVCDRLGGVHSARILLDSVDFADIEALQASGEWGAAGELLAARARALQEAGAGLIALCTNTMHKVIGAIEEAVQIPVIHIADAVAAKVREAGLERIGLLGTVFTMEQDFYRDRLAGHGIETLIPVPDDRSVVHLVIYDELVRGVVSEDSRRAYREIINRLVQDGAQGIILGCTEIEMLVSANDSPVPVFPTTRLHVENLVDAALAETG